MNPKVLLVGLLLAVAIVGLLMMESTKTVQQDMKQLDVAAGNVSYGDGEADMMRSEPFVHCYPVASPGELDVKTRMDFEARTTKGWVPKPQAAKPGEFCLEESPQAVAKRIKEATAEAEAP